MTAHALDSVCTFQVVIAATATRITAARRERKTLTITKHGSQDLFYGGEGVTTAFGALLAGTCGTYISLPTTAAFYGVVAAGDLTVSVTETYG